MAKGQAGDEEAPAPVWAVLSSGACGSWSTLSALIHQRWHLGRRTMTSKKQRQKVRKTEECCSQTISKEQVTEKLETLGQTLRSGQFSLEDNALMPQAALKE